MAKQGQTTTTNLEGLTVAAREATNKSPSGKGLPPVHLWNPPFCGDLDMRIAGDGTWFYMGTPIGRPALVPCEAGHGLRFEKASDGGLTPYLHVRADLWAKVTRALYYDLVDMGEERMIDGEAMFGVESGGEFFAMADAEQVRNAR
jgi:hypothetical protein